MNTEQMAKLPGMFQRGTVWWLRVMIPTDLQQAYAGRSKLVQSLDTSDWREASQRGAKRRAEMLEEFGQRRRALNPEPVAKITPELGSALAAGIRSRLLQWDEDLRGNPSTAETWLRFASAFSASNLSALRMGAPPPVAMPSPVELEALAQRSALDGLTPDQLRKLAEVNLTADEAAGSALAGRQLSRVVPLADSEARRLGLLVDWKAPEARPVLMQCLKAYRASMGDLVSRDQGNDVETPAAPAKAAAEAPPTLRDVFTKWKGTKRRSEDTERACERALEVFERQSGSLAVTAITRAQGVAFLTWLLGQKTSSKTAHDRLTWVKSLLRFAHRDLELLTRQPWEGLDIDNRTEAPRRPWTASELRAFFALPVFTTYTLPTVMDGAKDAAYWIPLLGLYMGARIGELCQLRVVDVCEEPEGWVLRITEEAEDAKLKTAASTRTVPVHSELIRLGFIDYVMVQRGAGSVSLWPAMRFRKGKAGANFSLWFRTAREQVPGGVPDFHSLRHTVRTVLAEAGLPEKVKDRVTGHLTKGSTGTRVYEHVSTAALRRAVEAIRYEGLAISRSYPAEAPAVTP